MKKYLVFGLSSQLGGVESFICNYVGNMMDKNNRFEFVVFDRIPDYFEKTVLSGSKCYIVSSRTKNPFIFYRQLCNIVKNGNYDVLWYNVCTLSDITLVKICTKYRVSRRIVHSHNSENMGGKLVGALHEYHKNIISKYATDFFACSNEAAVFMFPKNVRNVKIINNAIIAEKYRYNEMIRANVRDKLKVENEILIGHVGRFHMQKNHVFIIEVFRRVIEIDKTVKLMLIGDGELKNQIVRLAQKYGILNNIIFLEKRMDVNELMQAMDVFLFPSVFEGLGLALIEAQASDLPCVIADTIPKDAILTDRVDVLSLKDSVDKWARTILSAAKKKDRRDQSTLLSEKGYDIKENANKLKLYLQ